MIFVSVGTHPQPFHRLLNEIAFLVDKKIIREDVVVQSGNTPFTHPRMKISSFMDIHSFEKTLGECTLFITHAGEGNIGTALQMGKPLIIMPRREEKGEHTDDHQLELAHAIASRGDGVVVDSLKDWKTILHEAQTKASARRGVEEGHIPRVLTRIAHEYGVVLEKNKSEKTKPPQTASIVVATLNGGEPLIKAVNGMLRQDFKGKYEIIVVDDGSYDGKTPFLLKKNFQKNPHVSLIFLPRSGVCKARNAGIAKAQYEVVVNMDHDDNPESDWLRIMLSGFDSPDVGAVSAYGHYGGTSTAFRKDLLTHLGGYDEDFFYYREDTDLSFRIIELGYDYKKVDGAKWHGDRTLVTPNGVKSILKYTLQRLRYHMNDVLLHKKHPTRLCQEFLHVKGRFFVNPVEDFKVATGMWQNAGREPTLSSPRGMVFFQGQSFLAFALIVMIGIGYAFAIKWARLAGSLKNGHWLV